MRSRRVVAAGVVVAMLFALLAAGALERHRGGDQPATASAQVLVDTPHSLLSDLRAQDEAVGAQAALLPDLLADARQVQAIAALAHVPAASLSVALPDATTPIKPSPLADRAAATASREAVFALTIRTSTLLPIVTIDATAPDRAAAMRLAQATVATLRSLTAARAPAPSRALSVKVVEPTRAMPVAAGGSPRLLIVAIALLIVVSWCTAVVVGQRFVRASARHRAAPA